MIPNIRDYSAKSDLDIIKQIKGIKQTVPDKNGNLIVIERTKRDDSPHLRELLYIRYTPMIKKHAKKLLVFKKANEQLLEDYYQEAFITMLKSIDYVNVTKCRSNWSFKGVFSYYLKNLSHVFRKNLIAEGNCVTDTDFNNSRVHDTNEERIESFLEEIPFEDDKDILDTSPLRVLLFLNRNPPLARRVIDMRKKKMSIADIASYLGVSKTVVHKYLKQFRTYMLSEESEDNIDHLYKSLN